MASYNWDIGFDFNSLPDPNNDNKSYILNGCVQFTTDPNTNVTVASPGPKHFQVGDTVCFNGYNLTEGASVGDHSIVGGSIIFRPGDTFTKNKNLVSPFSQVQITIDPISSSQTGTSASIWTPPNAPGYFAVVPSFQIMNAGDFYFTILLQVKDNNSGTQLWFRVDPEMIVEAGPPGP